MSESDGLTEGAQSAGMPPCIIRILIVADGTIEYGEAEFGLSRFVRVLLESDDPKIVFTVKRAHRSKDPNADICDFRFNGPDKFDPDCYDEIWLFGYAQSEAALGKEEVICLWRFMDRGNGVFATGDHENLGAALCGSVPRVRTMRKWAAPTGPGPASPGRNDPFRHDSLRKGHDRIYDSRDERDDVPQVVFPRVYSKVPERPNTSDCCPRVYPHPLLCGRDETVLRLLPDHMHEGECYAPQDCQMNEVECFDGEDHPEYPMLSDGKRLKPEVIAWSRTPEPHVTYDPKEGACRPATQVSSFGVIGAYEGHLVDVGRVVVLSFARAFDLYVSGANNPKVAQAEDSSSWWSSLLSFFRSRNSAMSLAFAAGALLLVAGGAWLAFKVSQAGRPPAEIRVEQEGSEPTSEPGAPVPEPTPQDKVAEGREPGPSPPPANRPRPAPSERGPSVAPRIAATVFPGALRSGGQTSRVAPEPGERSVRVQLSLIEDRYQSYRAEIKNADREGKLPPQDRLKAVDAGSGRAVFLRIPLDQYPPGDYSVTLRGRTREGGLEDAGTYFFRVLRRE